MGYQKIINSNQQTKFWTKNWIEINDDARGTYSTNSQSKFKTLILKSSLSDYSDTYTILSGTLQSRHK